MISDFLQAVQRDLTHEGALRVALSLGNPVLARRAGAGAPLAGLGVDLSEELARRLAVRLELLAFDSPLPVVQAGLQGAWDVAFMSVQPERARQLDFTAPYMVMESTYLVREGAAFRSALDIDREGVGIAVAKGGFYDLRLARTLQRAHLVRCENFAAACEALQHARVDAVAGLRQPLAAFSATHPGLRVLEGRFAAVEQGIALHKGRSAGLRYLNAFLAQMKAGGLIAQGLERSAEAQAGAAPRAGD